MDEARSWGHSTSTRTQREAERKRINNYTAKPWWHQQHPPSSPSGDRWGCIVGRWTYARHSLGWRGGHTPHSPTWPAQIPGSCPRIGKCLRPRGAGDEPPGVSVHCSWDLITWPTLQTTATQLPCTKPNSTLAAYSSYLSHPPQGKRTEQKEENKRKINEGFLRFVSFLFINEKKTFVSFIVFFRFVLPVNLRFVSFFVYFSFCSTTLKKRASWEGRGEEGRTQGERAKVSIHCLRYRLRSISEATLMDPITPSS
jgi:hypothetical protein